MRGKERFRDDESYGDGREWNSDGEETSDDSIVMLASAETLPS